MHMMVLLTGIAVCLQFICELDYFQIKYFESWHFLTVVIGLHPVPC